MINEFKKYVYNTLRIRQLSTPSHERVKSNDEYGNILSYSFREIGYLAEENRAILNEIFFPLIKKETSLTPQEISDIMEMYDDLIYGEEMDNMDIPIGNLISGCLMANISNIDDLKTIIKIADMHATSCYLMMNFSKRTFPYSNTCEVYRQEGQEVCEFLLSFLELDKWNNLPDDETKRKIIELSHYKAVFYEDIEKKPEKNEEELQILRRSLSLSETEPYKNCMTLEQAIFHKLCVYEYFGCLLEVGNKRGFNHVQCYEITKHMVDLSKLWQDYPEICKEGSDYSSDKLMEIRSRFFVGDMSIKEYKVGLLELYNTRKPDSFKLDDVYINLLLPLEYIKLIERQHMTENKYATLEQFYRNAIKYIANLPNSGSLIYTLEYLIQLLAGFKEVPGGTTFMDIGLSCLAALHPPTYVHSRVVAIITRCLTKHLLRIHPEYFMDFLKVERVSQVIERGNEVLDYAYNSALCHDFGKIGIIDTVFVYGRQIQDPEFMQIKSHPQLGASMLIKNPSTSKYANVAMGHHRFYDDSRGYPDNMITSELPEKVFIDIVACADCMDAATDTTGRSYNKGKSLDEFIGEIEAEAGTRYAPYLSDLLNREEVRKDLEFILNDSRSEMYKETFVMLKRLQRMGN